jgi:hypothetical protein
VSRTLGVALAALAAAPLAAQRPEVGTGASVQGGVRFETYAFGEGLAFDRVSQLVIALTAAQRLGRRLMLDVATAYASASVRTIGGDVDISGLVDTDVRAALTLVPGRVIATLVGTLPTGQATVPDTTLPLYGATATDLFGFTVPTFGSGGGVTGGLATAFPVGASWAVGVGASYRHAAAYVPVEGGGELSPGPEGRVRVGMEGPLGRDAYLRATLVYSRSAHDEVEGGPATLVGDRVVGYVAFNLPLGRSTLSLYSWDMRRFHPSGSDGTRVPGGNVLALGARLERLVSPSVTLAPAIEFRHEMSGADSLAVLGWLARPGLDVRLRLGGRATLVASAHYAFGQVRDEGVTVSVHGPRLGLALEWSR